MVMAMARDSRHTGTRGRRSIHYRLNWDGTRYGKRSGVRMVRWSHEPPRSTFTSPSTGPAGFNWWSAGYSPYQSATHPQTLPAISSAPHQEAPSRGKTANWRRVCIPVIKPVVLPVRYRAVVIRSKFKLCPVETHPPRGYHQRSGPRAAYSHSASVGR